MNISEAAKALEKGKRLQSELGFAAEVDYSEDGDGMIVNVGTDEPFGFYVSELLSEKWTVVDE